MKLKNLFPFAAALVLPLSFVSCGDDGKKEEKKEETEGGSPDSPTPDATAKKDHAQIGKEVGGIMDSLMEGMSSISDKESAQDFVVSFGEQTASLAALLKAAKELDPPSAEEKAAFLALIDATDKKGEALLGKMDKMMTDNADGEAIGEILSSVMSDKEMGEVTQGFEVLYDLEDEAEELPAPEKTFIYC